ncbi:major facilitator superfamily domain-containing protein [Hyaloraphidium curvatum]|nr:major facilitator superfamily domain-containing protein [Hyaloraphidium curvatum]
MSKALSYIVAGAAIAAPIGPIATQYSVWLVPSVKYLGIYIIIDALIVAMSLVCMCLRFPPPAEKPKPQGAGGAAPEPEISRWKIMGYFLSNKRFLIAMIAGMTSYAVMVLMMAPAPLAIVGAGFTFADQANVIMAHVLGMFVPSLFTGWLIDRFGSITMNIIGMVILTAAIAILFGGEILPIFYVGETLVGVGWNFSFIASTSIIVKGAKPGRELQTVQGYNDSFIQLLAGVVVLISGPLYQAIHWLPLAGLALCLIGLAAIAILAVARLPIRGLRDGGMSAMDYKPQTDDVQLYDREEQKENEQRENEAQK